MIVTGFKFHVDVGNIMKKSGTLYMMFHFFISKLFLKTKPVSGNVHSAWLPKTLFSNNHRQIRLSVVYLGLD